jgi:hypothetical protein
MKRLKTDEAKAEYKALREELKKFDHLKPKPLPEAFVATDAGPVAPAVAIKTRKGEQQIEPGFPFDRGHEPAEDQSRRRPPPDAARRWRMDHAA